MTYQPKVVKLINQFILHLLFLRKAQKDNFLNLLTGLFFFFFLDSK